jgi:hypothetical protein
MEAFFAENGNKNLLFCYGEPETNMQVSKTTLPKKTKIQIVESSNISLRGICVFFVRNSTSILVTRENISQVRDKNLYL